MGCTTGPAFSILADETADISGSEQLSMCVRHVDDEGKPDVQFLGLWDIHKEAFCFDFDDIEEGEVLEPKVTGQKIAETLLHITEELGLDMNYCAGQGYDGAATMKSDNGVAGIIQSEYHQAAYTHCSSHSLNLALVSASKMADVRKMYDVVRSVASFVDGSPKRCALLQAAVQHKCPESKRKHLSKLCETGWVERHQALETFIGLFDAVVLAMWHMSQWSDRSASDKARPLLKAVQDPMFVVTLYSVADVTSATRVLATSLQGDMQDLCGALEMVDRTTEALASKRQEADESFSCVFKSATEKLGAMNVPVAVRRQCQPEYETDSFERIQSSPNPLAGDPDPVQSGLVDQKPIQSNPIRLVRTVQIFIYCVKCIHTCIIHLLTPFMKMSVDFAARKPPKRYMFYDKNNLSSNMK